MTNDLPHQVPEARALQPIELVHMRACHFKAKGCKTCGHARVNAIHHEKTGTCAFKRQVGCQRCGKAKNSRDHMGAPPSLGIFGSGNRQLYQVLKKQWEDLLHDLLVASGLPKGLRLVVADAEIIFPDQTRRDEGNIRFLLEKALGDTLTAGGWLEDDSFYPERSYIFGNLTGRYLKDESGFRLKLLPT